MGIQAARKIISCVAAGRGGDCGGNQKQANYDQREEEGERKGKKTRRRREREQKLKLQ